MTKRRSRRSAPLGRGPTEERNSKTLGSQDSRSWWETSVVTLPVDEIHGCDVPEIVEALHDEIRIEDPNCWNCGAPRERPEISDPAINPGDRCVFCGDWAQLRDCHDNPVCWPCEQAV